MTLNLGVSDLELGRGRSAPPGFWHAVGDPHCLKALVISYESAGNEKAGKKAGLLLTSR